MIDDMPAFKYIKNALYCEKVSLEDLIHHVGTPCYVYSYNAIIENFRRLKNFFASVEPLIAYSVKANSNGAILRALAREGSGFDVVSGGELLRALQAGAEPGKIIFAGVGKTADEIELAIKNEILMFNVESTPEAYLIDEIGRMHGKKIRIALRINPDVTPDTHKYITTGKKENKFGISWEQSEEIALELGALDNINLVGLHAHIGSQILMPETHLLAADRLGQLIKGLRKNDMPLQYINIGGGFGIDYKEGIAPFKIESLAARIIPVLKDLGCHLILEPGRWIVAPAGCLLTKILYIKPGSGKTFVIVDAALNDLIRPALYNAYHRIEPVIADTSASQTLEHCDVVGPVCESGDFLGHDRTFRGIRSGDALSVMDVGAYGFVMSSQYNSRLRPPEILVKDSHWFVIRERETIKDITRLEKIPDFLK